jgi:PKD repeat protein
MLMARLFLTRSPLGKAPGQPARKLRAAPLWFEVLEDRSLPSAVASPPLHPPPHITLSQLRQDEPPIAVATANHVHAGAAKVPANAVHPYLYKAPKAPPKGGKAADSPYGNPGEQLVNQGGPIITSVEVEAVYLGDYWQTSEGQQTISQLNGFFTYITSSPYMNVLAQYSAGPGQFAGSVVLPMSLPAETTLGDPDIQAALDQGLAPISGTAAFGKNAAAQPVLPAPDGNTLYFVFTPPHVHLQLGSDSSASDLLGYHQSFTDTVGQTVYYAAVANPVGNVSVAGLGALDKLTVPSSHELAEAITDPMPNDNPAWTDPNTGNEIGDGFENLYGPVGNYQVQYLWSNQDNAAVLTTSTTPPTPTPGGVTANGVDFSAAPGAPFSGIVATFTVPATPSGAARAAGAKAKTPKGHATAATYTASIDWGDDTGSTPGTVTVEAPAGATGAARKTPAPRKAATSASTTYDVSGSHTYADAGWYTVTITITAPDGTTTTVTASATVQSLSSQVFASGIDFNAAPGIAFTGNVAYFFDGNTSLGWYVPAPVPAAKAGAKGAKPPARKVLAAVTYTASIDWGDQSTSPGTVTATTWDVGGNDYVVSGTHTYATAGQYTVTITIAAPDGSTTATTATATVQPEAQNLVVSGLDFNASPGSAFSGTVAYFFDGNSNPGWPAPVSSAARAAGKPSAKAPTKAKDSTATYTASIDWGDGTTATPGTVSAVGPGLAGASYTVAGTHTYTKAGQYTVTITITAPDGSTTTGTATATVQPEADNLIVTGLDFNAAPGIAFSGTVAYFADCSGNAGGPAPTTYAARKAGRGAARSADTTTPAYTASIDWGDGTTTSGTVASAYDGSVARFYSVTGTHTYPQAGQYTVTITITAPDGSSTSAMATATVQPDADSLIVTGVDFNTTPGTAFSGTVAYFSNFSGLGEDPSPVTYGTATAGKPSTKSADTTTATYAASIDWGDGTTTAGTVSDTYDAFIGSFYAVAGTHTYASAGQYTVTITITAPDGSSTSGTATATVQPESNNIVLGALDFTAVPGTAFTGTVAYFSDCGAGQGEYPFMPTYTAQATSAAPTRAGDTTTPTYSASINWGDGTTTDGTVSAVPWAVASSFYSVAGTHTYASTGQYTVTVTVTAPDGSTASATATATVQPEADNLNAFGIDFSTMAGTPFSGAVAAFTDNTVLPSPGGQQPSPTYTATIDWGDGSSPSVGTVVAGSLFGGQGLLPLPGGGGLDSQPASPVGCGGDFYTVQGSHTYTTAGQYTVTVKITAPDGSTTAVTATATVPDTSGTPGPPGCGWLPGLGGPYEWY